MPIEFVFGIWITTGIAGLKKTEYLLLYSYTLFYTAYFIEWKIRGGINDYFTVAYIVGSVVMICLCFRYYYLLFYQENYTNLLSDPAFWFISGYFIYYTTGVGFNAYFEQLNGVIIRGTVSLAEIILEILNLILYSFWIISFICIRNKPTSTTAVITTCAIFLIVAIGLILLVIVYNRRKKRHIEEKALMKLTFDSELIKSQLEVQEQTMQTIGADLHDNIGQLLSLTSLTLNSIELDNQPKARQKIDAAIDLTVRSIKEMRLLGKLLQGDQLMVLGLPEAIRYEVNFMERSGHFEINYAIEGEPPANNNADKDLIIFRILQEILNNIIKHAIATEIVINLEYLSNQVKLEVGDNGIGFNTDELPAGQSGMGLHNIRKRAGIIGGEVAIRSNPGEGTQITIFIPFHTLRQMERGEANDTSLIKWRKTKLISQLLTTIPSSGAALLPSWGSLRS